MQFKMMLADNRKFNQPQFLKIFKTISQKEEKQPTHFAAF